MYYNGTKFTFRSKPHNYLSKSMDKLILLCLKSDLLEFEAIFNSTMDIVNHKPFLNRQRFKNMDMAGCFIV